MGYLERRRQRQVESIAKAIVAGMAPAPAAGVVTDARPLIDAIAQGVGQPLAPNRGPDDLPWVEPVTPFSPGRPIGPVPIDPRLPDTNRALPRMGEFPVSWNLPGQGQPLVPWSVLRRFADQVDVVRLCIGKRKKELSSVDWHISVRADMVGRLADEQGLSQARARVQATKDYGDEIARIQNFWMKPDRLRRFTFAEWFGMLIEEVMVLDALSIYPHPDFSGQLHSLEILDGATIKPLLDHRGSFPQAPQPAYQQILWGFPRGEFHLGNDDGDTTLTTDELIYRPRERRTWTPYGFSPTEQALIAGDLYLKRQEWLRQEYASGVVPEMLLLPEAAKTQWTPEQVRQYEANINAELSGNTAQRMRARVLPPGFQTEFPDNFAEKYNANLDEYLVKLLCAFFDVMPTELGFTQKGGLGGSGHQQGEQNSVERIGNRPFLEWAADIFNEVNQQYLGAPPELTFVFDLTEAEDEKTKADVASSNIKVGLTTLNDERAAAGQPLYSFEEADEPFVMTPNGPVFIKGMQEHQNTMQAFGAVGAQAGIDATKAGDGKGDDEPPEGGKPSDQPAPPTQQEKAAELDAFTRFARKRQGKTWRDFTFKHADAAIAVALNAAGADGDIAIVDNLVKAVTQGKGKARTGPGYASHKNLVNHYGARIHLALIAAFPHLDHVVRQLVGSRTVEKAATPEAVGYRTAIDPAASCDDCMHYRDGACTQVFGAIRADGWCDLWTPTASITKAAVDEGAAARMLESELDPSELEDLLAELTQQAWGAGVQNALEQLGKQPEWDTWTPGHAEAAAQLEGDGLRELLNKQGVTIKSILDVKVDQLAGALSDAVDRGLSVDDTAASIRDLLEMPSRADMIANTETNRAMTAATLETYGKNGVTKVDWLLSYAPCELCQENADASPIALGDDWPNGDSPVHPNCECSVAPAEVEAAPEGEPETETE